MGALPVATPPQVLNPISLYWPEFYRSDKQPSEIKPNHVNNLSSTSTELRIFKANSRDFISSTNTVIKMPLDRYHILQIEIDPCAVKGTYLECTPLRQERVAQNWFFMSYLGTSRLGTSVKAIQDFWSRWDNYSRFWSYSLWQLPE